MTWTVARKIGTYDFDVSRDPIGGFASKSAACDFIAAQLERDRDDLARAMRKVRQMARRARKAEAAAMAAVSEAA